MKIVGRAKTQSVTKFPVRLTTNGRDTKSMDKGEKETPPPRTPDTGDLHWGIEFP